MLKVNEYGGRQANGNEKIQGFKGWETLVINLWETEVSFFMHCSLIFHSWELLAPQAPQCFQVWIIKLHQHLGLRFHVELACLLVVNREECISSITFLLGKF